MAADPRHAETALRDAGRTIMRAPGTKIGAARDARLFRGRRRQTVSKSFAGPFKNGVAHAKRIETAEDRQRNADRFKL